MKTIAKARKYQASTPKTTVRPREKEREDKLRGMLLMKRQAVLEELQKELGNRRVKPFQGFKEGGLDLAEEAGAALEDEIGFAVIDQRAERVRQIDLALERLKEGAYGICEDCEEEISVGRLKALPFATRCTRCQERWEDFSARAPENGPLPPDHDQEATFAGGGPHSNPLTA